MVWKKILIVYFSQSGVTRKYSQALAKKLNCDIEELKDKKKRNGFFGFIKNCIDAFKGKHTEIEKIKYNPSYYDLVIIGTPVWAGKMVPAVRAYIDENINEMKNVVFFTTQGAPTPQGCINEMVAYSNKKPVAIHSIERSKVAKDFSEDIEEFVAKLK